MDRLTIQTNKTAYSPGDRVLGKICLNIPFHQSSTKLDLNFSGYEHYDLLLLLDCNKIRNHNIVYAEWPLYKWDDELPAGHIEVPFSFILPPNIPASFRQDTPEFRAHIMYTLEVKLDSKGRSIVTRYKNLVIRSPVSSIPKSFSEERTFPLRACCMSYGYLALKVQIEKDIYSEGDQVMAVVEIDTSHTGLDVSKIQFSLIQKTSFRHGYTFTYKTHSQNFPGMPARRGPETKILEFMIPLFIGDDPGDLLSRIEGLGLQTKGNIIRSEFFLEIRCKTKGRENCCHHAPTVLHPINISYPDPLEKAVLPENWNPQVLPEIQLGPMGFSAKSLDNRENYNGQKMIETKMPLGLTNEPYRSDLIGRQI